MDAINSVNGISGIQPPEHARPGQAQGDEVQNRPDHGPAARTQISQMGELFSAVQQSDEADENDLKAFHESIFVALQNGSFDAASLAENASDTIKAIAEEAGIDLEETLNEFADHAMQMNGAHPQGPPPGGPQGPPPPSDASSDVSDEDDEYSEWLKNNTIV